VIKDIGARIKRIRLNKGIDTKQIADEIGIRDTSFSKIEREGTNSVVTLLKIASALSVRITEFFEDNTVVAEPVERMGLVTRDEWLNANREMAQLFKTEMAKLRDELLLKKETYLIKKKMKKLPKK
jgi:transcriptional regulator with XRE-family HTH domain